MKNKMDLARLVKAQDGSVAVDATGKKPGRGAYICKDPACAELARKQRKIERCFEVSDAGGAYAELSAAIAAAAGGAATDPAPSAATSAATSPAPSTATSTAADPPQDI
jgi:predicted RNA-binding protein YlxR (DUF448 family)